MGCKKQSGPKQYFEGIFAYLQHDINSLTLLQDIFTIFQQAWGLYVCTRHLAMSALFSILLFLS
jgi:hypothetical protein